MLSALLSSPAMASPGPPLKFSEAYKAYLCADGGISHSQKSYEQGEEERAKLRDKYKEALRFPYAPEFQGYQPRAYQILERDRIEGWSWSRCAWFKKLSHTHSPTRSEPPVPRGFRCRLDRVVYGDRRTGERFAVTGVQLSLIYLVNQGTEEAKFVDAPPPLGSDIPRVYGQLLVRGRHKGKTAFLIHEWVQGSPAEMLYSESEMAKFASLPAAEIPYVNARTQDLYSFNISEQYAGNTLGPLRGRSWRPVGCQQ